MFKSTAFIFVFLYFGFIFAEDHLKLLAKEGVWKNYVPDNYELVTKLGDRAFSWSNDSESEKIEDSQVVTKDPFIIFKPDFTINTQRKTKSGILIYKAKYTFDAKSRRYTHGQKNPNNKNIIALGCSFTLGTGVNDQETFPFYLSELRKDYSIYNLGIYGAGANDILDDLRSFKRFEDISHKGGFVLHTAIFDHIERSLCTLNCYRVTYRDWVLKKSNYVYDEKNNILINKGSFAASRPAKGLVFQLLAGISLFDKINVPRELTNEQIEHYVRMLSEMKRISQEKLNSDFYFTFYPNFYEKWDRIKKSLEKHQIKYIDLSNIDFKEATDKRNVILLDGHPTKLANYLYASLLHQQLPK